MARPGLAIHESGGLAIRHGWIANPQALPPATGAGAGAARAKPGISQAGKPARREDVAPGNIYTKKTHKNHMDVK